ncbi:hypothetical protein K1719_006328 [Acacia pycnantha]|nr:hypothetical protein K1719_006328 [Acacia pycnantha]
MLRWDGISLKLCKAFRTEEGGYLKEKRHQNLKKQEVKLKRENVFWSSASSIISNTFKVSSKSVNDYQLAMAKKQRLEDAFSAHREVRALLFASHVRRLLLILAVKMEDLALSISILPLLNCLDLP